MKTAIFLPTAFVTTLEGKSDREERISQYCSGFNTISGFVKENSQFDVFVVDSTVESEDSLDERLVQSMNSIFNLKGKFLFLDNEYGRLNKGAGVITQWRYALSKVGDEYEYVIHFEPRQKLLDFSFFNRFISKPQNYAKTWFPRIKKYKIFPTTLNQILTGMIALNKKDLEKYCNGVDLDKMVRNRISIEDDIYAFLKKNDIKFENVERLGIQWHDTANDAYLEL